MIENIQYKFSESEELVAIAKGFIETYIDVAEASDNGIEEEFSGGGVAMGKDGDSGMTFNIWGIYTDIMRNF